MLQATPGYSITARPAAISRWLWAVAGLIVAMVVDGGITRLTESGLSITQWKPISGIVPPLNEVAFSAYARIQSDADARAAAFVKAARIVMTAALPFYVGLAVTAEPLVLAVLLSFVLAPVVNGLRRLRLGRAPSVIAAVLLALGSVDRVVAHHVSVCVPGGGSHGCLTTSGLRCCSSSARRSAASCGNSAAQDSA